MGKRLKKTSLTLQRRATITINGKKTRKKCRNDHAYYNLKKKWNEETASPKITKPRKMKIILEQKTVAEIEIESSAPEKNLVKVFLNYCLNFFGKVQVNPTFATKLAPK